jgi:hypothetical protein
MSTKTVAQKLLIKPGHRILPLNAPAGYPDLLGQLPQGAAIVATPPADVVHLFVRGQAEVGAHAPAAFDAVGPGGLVWISYPKGKSELHRDTLWTAVQPLGWVGVTLVAVDATWSAMRFRPA